LQRQLLLLELDLLEREVVLLLVLLVVARRLVLFFIILWHGRTAYNACTHGERAGGERERDFST
jgi:hypothetical protein